MKVGRVMTPGSYEMQLPSAMVFHTCGKAVLNTVQAARTYFETSALLVSLSKGTRQVQKSSRTIFFHRQPSKRELIVRRVDQKNRKYILH